MSDQNTGMGETKDVTHVHAEESVLKAYWSENRNLVFILLFVWFLASFGVALIAPYINSIVIAGFPLAYYMGAQGSLIVFVLIILLYAIRMNAIDKKYDLHEDEE